MLQLASELAAHKIITVMTQYHEVANRFLPFRRGDRL